VAWAEWAKSKILYSIFLFTVLPRDIEVFELEWYLRDHFFRKYNQEGSEVVSDELPSEMVNLYLRYRGVDINYLSDLMQPVLERLEQAKVIIPFSEGNIKKFKISSNLSRFQCSQCKYISYLCRLEPNKCLRCSSTELHDFPRKVP